MAAARQFTFNLHNHSTPQTKNKNHKLNIWIYIFCLPEGARLQNRHFSLATSSASGPAPPPTPPPPPPPGGGC